MRLIASILFFLIILGLSLTAQTSEESMAEGQQYFPLPDSAGGWRTLTNAVEIMDIAGMDINELENAFNFVRSTTKNGGLLVLRHGWLVYEQYFGKGQRDATPNLASCGKSFTSIAVGILINERPDLFPDGLDQKVFTPKYLPEKAFPLPDPRMADIKLGQLLAFTSGIRGNNPVFITGKDSIINPIGPDGWNSMVDDFALGIRDGNINGTPFTTKTLWCEPGGGYSYASASIHIASIMLRYIAGMELEDYIELNLARPMGWGSWGFGYKNQSLINHTPGAGGIALRSTDMLRFCYMLLHNGRWGNNQIALKEFIQKAVKATSYNEHYPYSFQFHVNTDGNIKELPKDAFWKSGSGGHCFFIVPSLDLIVWKLGGRDDQYSFENTGIPQPETNHNLYGPTQKIQNPQDGSNLERTLAMVIDAIVDEKANTRPLNGQIIQDPDYQNKLVYNKDDNQDGMLDPFFLCGPGDPEGFLYRGTRNVDGTRDGDQMILINKLKKQGGNCIYLQVVRTHGGDAKNSNRDEPEIYPDLKQDPWNNQNPKEGLNEKILDQWEAWFDEMDKNGIVIYLFLYDDQINVAKQFGWSLDANGNLNIEEKDFIQAIVKRFKHHKNLIWCVMEEGQEIGSNWQNHISKIAEAIREEDNYNHIIASHQLNGNVFYHDRDSVIKQFAIQAPKEGVRTADSLHQWLLQAWINSQDRYSLNLSEDHIHGSALVPEKNREGIRKRNWAAAMTGTHIMILGMDIKNTPKEWLNDCKTLQTFFESTNVNQMHPCDHLSSGETNYVLANEGFDYILYSSKTEKGLGITNIPDGTYSFFWLDCVTGSKNENKNILLQNDHHLWKKPSGFGSEIALYIRREDKRPEKRAILTAGEYPVKGILTDIAPNVLDKSLIVKKDTQEFIQLGYDDPDGGPGPYTIIITSMPEHGTLSGTGNDRYFLPDRGYTGNDRFSWKVYDGNEFSEEAVVTLNVK